MSSNTFTTAPTGFLGTGSVDVRPAAVLSMEAVRAQLQGTALPVAVRTAVRLRPAPQHMFIGFTKNDGTTLGNLSSRRPLS